MKKEIIEVLDADYSHGLITYNQKGKTKEGYWGGYWLFYNLPRKAVVYKDPETEIIYFDHWLILKVV